MSETHDPTGRRHHPAFGGQPEPVAACDRHPFIEAISRCDHCNQRSCTACLVAVSGEETYCFLCARVALGLRADHRSVVRRRQDRAPGS